MTRCPNGEVAENAPKPNKQVEKNKINGQCELVTGW